jgi:hypothetical protein
MKILPHKKETGKGYLKMDNPDKILQTLEKHMMKLSTYKTSQSAKAFATTITKWD